MKHFNSAFQRKRLLLKVIKQRQREAKCFTQTVYPQCSLLDLLKFLFLLFKK